MILFILVKILSFLVKILHSLVRILFFLSRTWQYMEQHVYTENSFPQILARYGFLVKSCTQLKRACKIPQLLARFLAKLLCSYQDSCQDLQDSNHWVVNVRVIPRGGVGKLLRARNEPSEVQDVKQGCRWYILENGMITHYDRLKQYVPRMSGIELGDQAREEVQPLPDPAVELQWNVEFPSEDHQSDEGTFDGDSVSELFFTAPDSASIPSYNKILRSRSPVDYHKNEKFPEFELFHISEADSLPSENDDRIIRSCQGSHGALSPAEDTLCGR